MKQLHLVACSTHGHVETPLRLIVRQSADAAIVATSRYHSQKDDVTFVTLEVVRVSTDKVSLLDFLCVETLDKKALDFAILI